MRLNVEEKDWWLAVWFKDVWRCRKQIIRDIPFHYTGIISHQEQLIDVPHRWKSIRCVKCGKIGLPTLHMQARHESSVPRKFVRPGETLATVLPVTYEWPFPCVPTKMSLEMGGLAVDLGAVGVVANVLLFSGRTIWVCDYKISPTNTGTPKVT